MESAVTAPVSGHVKRVVVHEGQLSSLIFKLRIDISFLLRRLYQPGRSRGGNRPLGTGMYRILLLEGIKRKMGTRSVILLFRLYHHQSLLSFRKIGEKEERREAYKCISIH